MVWGSVTAPPVVVPDLVVRSGALGFSDGSLGGWLDTSAGAGASPLTTDTGCEERPILCAVRRLTDQVSAAVTARPMRAAVTHTRPRRASIMAGAR